MANIKKVDCALLPPCKKTLRKKVQRAHYVSIMWGNADSAEPGQDLDPVNFGWKCDNGLYSCDWFAGSPVPDDLFLESTNIRDGTVQSDNREKDYMEDMIDEQDIDDLSSGPEWSDDSDSGNDM